MKLRHLAAMFLLTLGAKASLYATDYYVSTRGDDQASGGENRPFRSLGRAIAAARQPGDSVVVRGGLYLPGGTLNLVNPGAGGREITLRAFEGEEAIVDGRNTPDGANLLVVGTHDVSIQGLTVRNAKGNGITVWGPGSRVHRVRVSGNTVHHCQGSGIYAGFNRLDDPVREVVADGNTVHHVVLKNRNPPHASWAFALGTGLSKNVSFRGNTVFQNHGEGIGFYLADGGVAEGNVVHDNFSVNLYLDNATHTQVSRNLAYSTGDKAFFRFDHPAAGIQIANEAYGALSNPSAHNEIVSNILLDNLHAFSYGAYQCGGGLRHTVFAHNTARGATGSLIRIDADEGHVDVRLFNNVFQQTGGVPMTDLRTAPGQIQFANNLWHGGRPQDAARNDGDVYADPLFVGTVDGGDEATGCQLRNQSPARGAGLEAGRLYPDFGGTERSGSKVDLGAWMASPRE